MSAVRPKACLQQAATGPLPLRKGTDLQCAANDDPFLHSPLQQNSPSDKFSFAKGLSVCSQERDLENGRVIHAFAVCVGLDSDAVVATSVLNVYGKCGILEDAYKTFDMLPKKDAISWNAILTAYVHHGLENECLQLYADMQQKCVLPDKFTFASTLSACATLKNIGTGLHIHARWSCIKGPCGGKIVDTALLSMYGKCRRINNARWVFNEMDYHDMISWNAMISGYAQVEHTEDAFCMFNEMLGHGMIPNKVTVLGLLDACLVLSVFQEIHSYLVEIGLEMDVVLGSSLVNMYCKFSSLFDAFKVFDRLTERNLITWNSMMAGYTTHRQVESALELFCSMQIEGINPDSTTWSTLLEACSGLDSPVEGECMYDRIISVGLEHDSSVAASAIRLYGKFGNFDALHTLFQKIPQKNFSLWNTLIMVYVQHGFIIIACELLHEMHESGVISTSQIYIDLLGACTKHVTFSEGRWIHMSVALVALDTDASVLNALINMYGKCGSLEDAWFLFDKMPERDFVAWTTIISTYAQFGNGAFAIHLYSRMQKEMVFLDEVTFISLIKLCSRYEFLSVGRSMHKDITIRGFDLDIKVGNALTDMYGKCGVIDDAKNLFENMFFHDVVSWNTIIAAYAWQGRVSEVFESLAQMERDKINRDEVTFVSVLFACTIAESFAEMRLAHHFIVFDGIESNSFVAPALISEYGKWGRLEDAQEVFNRTPAWNLAAWKAMIMALIEQGKSSVAIQVFVQMQTEGVLPDKASYVCTLKAFASSASLLGGKHLHGSLISLGFSQDCIVTTALVSMYSECCSLENACTMFHEVLEKDEVTWAAMQGAFLENESYAGNFQLFERMLEEAILPNLAIFLIMLQACTSQKGFTEGCRLHARLVCGTFLSDSKVRNAILNLYGDSGSIADLERFFNAMPVRDVTSHNVMMKHYVHASHPHAALQMFYQLEVEGLIPDIITLVSCLEACGSLGAYFEGRSLHSCIITSSFVHVIVNNALISMYSKSAHLQEAMDVFVHIRGRNMASWNAILSAYCQWECGRQALQMFDLMLSEGCPDSVTFVTVLSACTSEEALTDGQLLHTFIVGLGFEQEVVVGNSLITMYGKCGGFQEAETVFEGLLWKNTATWNTKLMVDSLQGDKGENVYLLEHLQKTRLVPNEITIASVLDCCASNGAVRAGRLVHMHAILCGVESDVSVVTSLVEMFGKCGILKDAWSVFKAATHKNSFTWTAMIAAYAGLGQGEEVLLLLDQMHHLGLVVDRVTLSSIFSACSCSGLLDQGNHFLFQMLHGCKVAMHHLDSVIDLLGRMGQLAKAEMLIVAMPFQPATVTWTALLGACRNVGDVGRAYRAAAHILELDEQNTAACLMLSQTHLVTQSLLRTSHRNCRKLKQN